MHNIAEIQEQNNTTDLVAGYDDPGQGWKSRQVRARIQEEYYTWLAGAVTWRNFVTLTLREDRPPDVVNGYFKRLIQVLNKEVYGSHYTHVVGHSYFNYVVGMERQVRGVLHLHVLADRPLHYQFIHRWWGFSMGYSLIEKVKDQKDALRYVTKYVYKAGEENVEVYLGAPKRKPKTLPLWWFE